MLEAFVVGDRVTHDGYGLGKVISVDNAEYVSVDFGANVVRRVPVTARRLSKL